MTYDVGITEDPSHSTVHEIYSSHFRVLLSSHFPDVLIDTLQLLLQGLPSSLFFNFISSSSIESHEWKITLKIWEELICVLQHHSHLLTWNVICIIFQLFTSYFTNIRLESLQTKSLNFHLAPHLHDPLYRSPGIYISWTPYILPISDIFKIISHQLITIGPRDSDGGWSLVDNIYKVFTPWIQPIISSDSG